MTAEADTTTIGKNNVSDPNWNGGKQKFNPKDYESFPEHVNLKKPMFKHDWHFEKVFSINDYWKLVSRPQGWPEVEVIVQTEPKEIKKKLPCLHSFADNIQILKAREALFDELVGRYKWSIEDAFDKIVPSWNTERFKSVYDTLDGDEDTKWARTWDKVIKDKTGFEAPAKTQKEYFAKIQRIYLEDNYKLNPEEYYEILKVMNGLMGQIESTESSFTEDEMWDVFTQSVRGKWEDHAKDEGFLDDQEKFMDYCKKQHVKEWDICEKTSKDDADYQASLMAYLHY